MVNIDWENLNLTNYYNYINSIIETRGQYNASSDYYEVHHIILKSFGGEPAKINHKSKHQNLVWLTLKEHYIAHKILALDNLNNYKVVYAYMMMSTRSNGTLITDANEYQCIRESFIKHDREINTGKISPMRGKHYDDNFKLLVSKCTKEVMADPNIKQKLSQSALGREPWNKNLINCYSDEALNKMSIAHQHPLSEQHKLAISEGSKGRAVSEATKQKISDSQSGQNCKHNKKILCIETNTEYFNAKTAAELLNINHSNIIQVCKGNRLIAGGLHFKYI